MHRMYVMVALAAIVAGCGGLPAPHEAKTQSTEATSSPGTAPAEAVAEASPKKPKLSCVQ